MNRKGFTLIELLIVVVIIGILAAIAIPKFANTKQKAVIASMKSDLRNLVTAEEAYFSDQNTYTGTMGPVQTAANVAFVASTGNTVVIAGAVGTGWSATVTNPAVAGATPATCGIYVGTAAPPNAAVTNEGAPACW
jgi:prepilin-type N-terminal cleavage/methylation domain-containing protein